MDWKKRGSIAFLVLISLLVVSCEAAGGGGFDIGDIWDKILKIGNLEFLGMAGDEPIVGFMRILVGILVFAILYEASALIGFLGKNSRIVITIVIAIISAVFIPGSILAGIGGAYATLVAFVLIGIPVIGGGYALYRIPSTNRGLIFLKIMIILLLIWVLIAVKNWALILIG